jgi:hypothetical protein
MKAPKIILYDIETSYNIGATWGKWDQNVLRFFKEVELLSFSFKELKKGSAGVVTRLDKRGMSDRALAKELWHLHNEADVTIAHNGNSFDNKLANARFLKHNFSPPSPYQSIDTKLVAKKYFRFNGNSLDDLARFLGIGTKVKHTGLDMWTSCMAAIDKRIRAFVPDYKESEGKKSWALMAKYNRGDVELLEKVYLRLREWMTNHPNLSVLGARPNSCPKCFVVGQMQSRGFKCNSTSKFREWQCQACRGWSRSRLSEKIEKPERV